MPTASIAARAGVLSVSTGSAAGVPDVVAELRNITLNADRDTIDATSNDSSGYREFIHGNATWTATAEALYVPSTANTQYIIRDAWEDERSLAVRVFPTTSTPYNWSGTALITHWDLGGGSNDAWAHNVTLQGTAALTFSTST